jgi:hypothetical protein
MRTSCGGSCTQARCEGHSLARCRAHVDVRPGAAALSAGEIAVPSLAMFSRALCVGAASNEGCAAPPAATPLWRVR